VVQALLSCPERDPFVRGLVAWVGFRQKPFLYERANRELGTTKYPLHKMFRFAFSALLAFSAQPLYLGIYLGLLGILSAAAITGWALWQWGVGHTVPGWTSLLLAYMTGQSVILGVLGVFGVYLARLFREVQGRPRFVVRRISGGDAPAVPDAGPGPPVRQWRSQLDT
jgi:dolichol-phosphate mannosyltransferase